MRGRIFGGFVVLAVMAVVVCSGAPPALAQTTWSVTNPNGDGSFSATAGGLTVTNVDAGATTSCSSATMDGTFPTAAGVHDVGTLTFGEATACTGPAGSSPTVSVLWQIPLVGRSYDPTAGRATLEAMPYVSPLYVDDPGCSYVADGPFAMTYTNGSAELSIDGAPFTVVDASGPACDGVAAVGDTVELSVGYTVTPAVTLRTATPSFTVTGSSPDGRFTTTQSDATTHTLGDMTTANHSPCSAATVAGTFPNGSGRPGVGIGSVTSANLGQCALFPYSDGVFTITPANLPWRLDAASYVSSDGGVVSGSIANFRLSVSGPGCSFSVTSTPASTDWRYGPFNGRPHVLIISPDDARITDVQGCAGSFNNGDQALYSNAYSVNPTTLQITAR